MLKIFVVTVALSLSSCPGAIGKALRLWGYTEVRPPATYWEPGTLVYIKHSQPFEFGTVCTAERVLGADFKPRESLTMNADMSRISKKGVTLEVDVANMVNSNNVLNDMSDLKMTLNNGHIFEVTDYDIESRRQFADPFCIAGLKKRIRDGYKITMIASALRADVVYNVSWDRASKLSLAAKLEALANLSASLGAEANPQTTNKMNGNGLYWGVRDDQYLAYRLLDPEAIPPVEPDSRIIPITAVISAKPPAPTPQPQPAPGPMDPNAPKLPTTQSIDDGTSGPRLTSWVEDDGTVNYEIEGELPPPEFMLTPADPNEDWQDKILQPEHGT